MKTNHAPLCAGLLLFLGGASSATMAGVPHGAEGASPERTSERISDARVKIAGKAAKLDQNKDGWLTENETSKGKKLLSLLYSAAEARVDLNGDGKISVSEYVEAQVIELKRADTNKDGTVTKQEADQRKNALIAELLLGNR